MICLEVREGGVVEGVDHELAKCYHWDALWFICNYMTSSMCLGGAFVTGPISVLRSTLRSCCLCFSGAVISNGIESLLWYSLVLRELPHMPQPRRQPSVGSWFIPFMLHYFFPLIGGWLGTLECLLCSPLAYSSLFAMGSTRKRKKF